MSQTIILQLLKELGRASTGDVRRLAQERYPDRSLYQYASQRLAQLHKWGIVDRDKDGFWFVLEADC